MKYLLFLLFIIPQTLLSQISENHLKPTLKNIAWISGTWHGEAFGGQTEEIWSQPTNGSMMATFKLMVDGNVQFYEIEIIREVENSLLLQLKHFSNDLKGWETKDQTVDFPLKYITKNKVVFEGMTFERLSDTEMTVYVDMKEKDGSVTVMPFKYNKKIANKKPIKQLIEVNHSKSPIIIDGKANETIWKTAQWLPLDQLWLGNPYQENDFKGRYKLAWNKEALYLLAEITDDKLLDKTKDPLKVWWDDDCLEIFIDEDNSGGEHQYNHNAFAYHIALDGNVVDMSTKKEGKLYNSHIESKIATKGKTSIWETKILIFNDGYKDEGDNTPIQLMANKNIGFALAYCDNDNSDVRENFIGSVFVEGEDKNRGWIDANIFGTLILKN